MDIENGKTPEKPSTPPQHNHNSNYVEPEISESQVITYTAPWNMFAIGFSNKAAYPFRVGIASFLPEVRN
jgi:hypothetical protein